LALRGAGGGAAPAGPGALRDRRRARDLRGLGPDAARPGRPRRGAAGQRQARRRERRVRTRAVAFCRWAARHGLTLTASARRLGLAARTLRRWVAAWSRDRIRARGRGRPARRSPLPLRARALALIGLLGPRVGVPTLQALCPGLARREVADLLRRYRRAWRRKRRLLLRTLRWTRPGTVWAIDFAEPPRPVEGQFARLLAVRDLASGLQLAWLPVADESARTARDALEPLFARHGAPLVLKSDNGSAFLGEEFGALLAARQVGQLLSPPRTPQYNGSCEAGIGSMKARTHHEAARAGRPGEWTCDDAEAARLQANQTARPWGPRGPTPDEAWQGRRPISAQERAAFWDTVRRRESEARQEQGCPPGAELDPVTQAAVGRVALRRALVAHGLLAFTSGTQPDSRCPRA
jgi:transposase InsO family protein